MSLSGESSGGPRRDGAAANGGLLEIRADTAVAFRVPTLDASGQFSDELAQRSAQRVIDGFSLDVGAGRHEVRDNAKGRTRFVSVLDEHPRLVDVERGT